MHIQELYSEEVAKVATSQKIGVIIPTYNASRHWSQLHSQLEKQGLQPFQILIIDSSSTDNTQILAEAAGYQTVRIHHKDFNHGATRQLACSYLPWAEYLVFMTQDAILADSKSIETLCRAFSDPAVGAAYGRQLPRPSADPIETHGRLFNYPPESQIRTFASRDDLGFKAAFFSNSFAVYRRDALEQVGGFPADAIVSEEVTVAARMLICDWKIVYQAEAKAFHSHSLTPANEFARYFDIGVHHGRTPWLLKTFGKTGGEGLNYVRSELQYLWASTPLWIPYAILRMFSKYIAYHLGRRERFLPRRLKRILSAHPNFWLDTFLPEAESQTSNYTYKIRHNSHRS